MKIDNIILLDLDGVLITTPQWKPDKMHEDGYTDFDEDCVKVFNELADELGYDIVLISDRRRGADIDKMNERFKARGVKKSIAFYMPDYNEGTGVWLNRRQEVELFLEEYRPENYLIIDDDKSLCDLSDDIKRNWIQTDFMIGLKNYKK